MVGLRVKFGAIDVDAQVAQLQGIPLRMWGIGSEAAPSTSTSPVSGSSVSADADDDGADVEGPGHRRVITATESGAPL